MPSTHADRNTLNRKTGRLSLGESVFQSGISTSEESLRTRAAVVSSTSPKKKKPSNAFMLFRSHMIANGMLPKEITHQNDVSRWAGSVWHKQDDETRRRFFRLAEEEKARWMMDDGSDSEITNDRSLVDGPSSRKPVVQMPTPPASPHSMQDKTISPSLSVGSPDSSSSNDSPSFHSPINTQLHKASEHSSVELADDIPPRSIDPFDPETEIIDDMPESNDYSYAFEWSATDPASSISLKYYA
ncbi:hypothetical protein EW145_g6040 [Phellinidium pouzarii]|uniref:HMG box domain-containing protein n=1 Tax=Phellinidium pouzarii TaxID=167371 RepID=A0A4S4KZ39_9AGAM|nr:hypothetical protein EW145_g6040 [Phellinidium pouzarii]